MLQKLTCFSRSWSIPLLLAALAGGSSEQSAAAGFQTSQAADVVLGQSNFTTTTSPPLSPSGVSTPYGVAMDPTTGKVFVADQFENRVLRFSSAAAAVSGSSAEAVFGQPNFTAHSPNQGGAISANTLFSPIDVSVDSAGRLWVVDTSNNRVLGFYQASYLGNDPTADFVLGQPNFTSGSSGTTAATMNAPYSVSAGSGDVVWVADYYNSRILRFDHVSAKTNPALASADGVLGQALFTTSGTADTADGLSNPGGVFADANDRLWVADTVNHRVLRYDAASSKENGANADGVLGQPDLVSGGSSTGPTRFNSPYGLYLDPSGGLWVAESGNSRVMHFSNAGSLANGASADFVLGQPDFASTSTGTTARKLANPVHLGGGPGGSVFVADYGNSRVLRFSPIASPIAAPPPVITLSGKRGVTTSKSTISLHGKASDAQGTLAHIEVKVDAAAYKRASGTANWKFTAELKRGKNILFIRAIDISGTSSVPLKITVERR